MKRSPVFTSLSLRLSFSNSKKIMDKEYPNKVIFTAFQGVSPNVSELQMCTIMLPRAVNY